MEIFWLDMENSKMKNNYIIKVKRQLSSKSNPYWQSFSFQGDSTLSISDMLDKLNFADDLIDIEGKIAPRIAWECSCQQGVCGACAMVICGTPALACKTKLSIAKKGIIVLEPLSKFPVVRDLCVDRSSISDILVEKQMWLKESAIHNEKFEKLQYVANKCMKCGLCIEVCPNTGLGGKNKGACFAVECFLKKTLDNNNASQKNAKDNFSKLFAFGCSKSFSCEDICPAKIDLKSIICLMNK
jgi:succinate dehydrogenase / fumarate reductase iron-sulfur subunit